MTVNKKYYSINGIKPFNFELLKVLLLITNDMAKQKKVKLENLHDLQAVKDSLTPGMTVRIYQKIKELNAKGQEKEREQYFEGLIIARKHGREIGATITVTKISDNVRVDKIFPINLPTITKIEIKKQSEVRRAKLYFIKNGYKKNLKTVAA